MTPSLSADASGAIFAPSPAAAVELDAGAGLVRYRLVRQPGDRQPARDHLGNHLGVPVQHDLDLES